MIRLNNNFDGTWLVGKTIIHDLNELKTVLSANETLEVCFNHVRYALYSTNMIIASKFDLTIELLINDTKIEPEDTLVLALHLDEEDNKIFKMDDKNG